VTDYRVRYVPAEPHFPGKRLDIIGDMFRGLDILLDFIDASQGKFGSLINRAKEALIPRAVAREPEKKASRLIWGSDGALFKIHLTCHVFITAGLCPIHAPCIGRRSLSPSGITSHLSRTPLVMSDWSPVGFGQQPFN
jgi:hypothetical protein